MTDTEILDQPAVAASEDAAASGAADLGAAEPSAAATEPETAAAEPAQAPEAADELDYPDEEPAPEHAAAEPAAAPAGDEIRLPTPAERWGTAAVQKLLAEQPELAQIAEANPGVKAQLFQIAKRSEQLAAYQDVIPSLALAHQAAEAYQALGALDERFYGSDPEQFWQALHDASGDPRAYTRNIRYLQGTTLDALASRAEQTGDAALDDAVAVLRRALGFGAGERQSLPADVQRELAELQQYRSAGRQREDAATTRWLEQTAEQAREQVGAFVDGILAKSRLSDYDRANVRRDFTLAVKQLGDEDPVLNAAIDEIVNAGGHTPQSRAAALREVDAWVRRSGREILAPILKRAGASLRPRAASAPAPARAANGQFQPQRTGAPAAKDDVRAAVARTEKKIGRRLSDREILEL